MFTNFFRGLLLMSIGLLWNDLVHAEGGTCPPGMYPANPGGTSGVNACYPIPGYGSQQQAPQQPTEQWERRWGALATSVPDGVLGASTNKRSEREASQVATRDCAAKGGLNCKIEITYDNQCAVVVVGDGGYNASNAATASKAVELSMKTCRDAGRSNCHVYYSACSLPVRIR